MKFKVYTTEEFDKLFSKLNKDIQNKIACEIDQLEENPYVGKPLGYKFFREKKVKGYRIYYLIYEDYLVVFIITISGKKDQQEVIDAIKKLIPIFKEEIKKKFSL
jgi:mRNA-degrading endonuclease RelE of RelBE toxin-antitoxin system